MKGSEPAFPIEKVIALGMGASRTEKSGGLTKREYFAVKALQGLCANNHPDIMVYTGDTLVEEAVGLADKLLSELNKE